jgi:hypothetical protein
MDLSDRKPGQANEPAPVIDTFSLTPEMDGRHTILAVIWWISLSVVLCALLAWCVPCRPRVEVVAVLVGLATWGPFVAAVLFRRRARRRSRTVTLTVSDGGVTVRYADTGALAGEAARRSVTVVFGRWYTPWWEKGRWDGGSTLDMPALVVEGVVPFELSIGSRRLWSGTSGPRVTSPRYAVAPTEWEHLVAALEPEGRSHVERPKESS